MATSRVKQTTSIILELSESEASWLKAYLQNAHSSSETLQDEGMRGFIWNALSVDL
jgi:hypothetical protein